MKKLTLVIVLEVVFVTAVWLLLQLLEVLS